MCAYVTSDEQCTKSTRTESDFNTVSATVRIYVIFKLSLLTLVNEISPMAVCGFKEIKSSEIIRVTFSQKYFTNLIP